MMTESCLLFNTDHRPLILIYIFGFVYFKKEEREQQRQMSALQNVYFVIPFFYPISSDVCFLQASAISFLTSDYKRVMLMMPTGTSTYRKKVLCTSWQYSVFEHNILDRHLTFQQMSLRSITLCPSISKSEHAVFSQDYIYQLSNKERYNNSIVCTHCMRLYGIMSFT